MTVRRGVEVAAGVGLATAGFAALVAYQGREIGLGTGTAIALGATEAVGWALLAPGVRAIGVRTPITAGRWRSALATHLVSAALFSLAKTAIDFAVAQAFVPGVPPAGPGLAGNALVYAALVLRASSRALREPPAARPGDEPGTPMAAS
jgi:hypothetical protein